MKASGGTHPRTQQFTHFQCFIGNRPRFKRRIEQMLIGPPQTRFLDFPRHPQHV
jgi:hypothetical protein